MDGFAQMMQDELTATPPPRHVVLRPFGDALREWANLLGMVVISLFLSYVIIKIAVDSWVVDKGVQTTAKVFEHSTSREKGYLYHYLHVAFPDQGGTERKADICVGQPEYEAHVDGDSIEVRYIPGFTQWAVSSQYRPNPNGIYGALPLVLLVIAVFQFSISRLINDYQYFKYGVFAIGRVTNVDHKGGGISGQGRGAQEIIRVEYLLNGVKNETVITRPLSDSSLNTEVAVVVIFDRPGKIRMFFNNDNCSIFQVKVPDSFYNQQ